MHYGEPVSDERFINLVHLAWESGIRTFVTADVYGNGRADELLGRALQGIPRSEYCLAAMVGHDFYTGVREGSRGYPRFTDPALRQPSAYGEFLQMAVGKSLVRCGTDHFDLLMLHNPDERGYTHEAVWNSLRSLRDEGLTSLLGIAPGPANGFAYDLIHCFGEYREVIDWAMIILNPLEPWPGSLVLPAAQEYDVDIITRVVDYGGLFHGDIGRGHVFRPGDHRTHRPAGWVDQGLDRIDAMRPIAERHGLSLLHFASLWNLAQPPVRSVVPTFTQEAGEDARPIEDKVRELAALPEDNPLTPEEVREVARIGDNTGCMDLKGASRRHRTSDRPDEWAMRPELVAIGDRWGLSSIP